MGWWRATPNSIEKVPLGCITVSNSAMPPLSAPIFSCQPPTPSNSRQACSSTSMPFSGTSRPRKPKVNGLSRGTGGRAGAGSGPRRTGFQITCRRSAGRCANSPCSRCVPRMACDTPTTWSMCTWWRRLTLEKALQARCSPSQRWPCMNRAVRMHSRS